MENNDLSKILLILTRIEEDIKDIKGEQKRLGYSINRVEDIVIEKFDKIIEKLP